MVIGYQGALIVESQAGVNPKFLQGIMAPPKPKPKPVEENEEDKEDEEEVEGKVVSSDSFRADLIN